MEEVVTRHQINLAYGWRAGNLNWPIRIRQAGKNLMKNLTTTTSAARQVSNCHGSISIFLTSISIVL